MHWPGAVSISTAIAIGGAVAQQGALPNDLSGTPATDAPGGGPAGSDAVVARESPLAGASGAALRTGPLRTHSPRAMMEMMETFPRLAAATGASLDSQARDQATSTRGSVEAPGEDAGWEESAERLSAAPEDAEDGAEPREKDPARA